MTETREQQANTHEVKQVLHTTCCIVGGGPAGTLLALLLAQKGVPVLLLEAHMDFERDFRGDTLHPAAMNIIDEMGLADRLLQVRHTEMRKASLRTAEGEVPFADFSHLKTKYPYITIMAQAQFLDFLVNEGKNYPDFHLVMGAQVEDLLEENGQVCGVRYRGHDGWYEVRAALTVGADGRFSRIRRLAGFEPIKTSPLMDVLWFRISRKENDPLDNLTGRFGTKMIVAIINRFDYWQIGYVIPKGSYQQIRSEGMEHLRETLAKTVPEFADRVDELQEWKQISVLSVESSRIPRWYRPGLLLIGDAAHVMSPVGGVGINYAIQDAAAAANLLTDKLKDGTLGTKDLARVQRQRELPTRVIQGMQRLIQERALGAVFNSDKPFSPPPWFKILFSAPIIRNIPPSIMGFGLFPVHLKK